MTPLMKSIVVLTLALLVLLDCCTFAVSEALAASTSMARKTSQQSKPNNATAPNSGKRSVSLKKDLPASKPEGAQELRASSLLSKPLSSSSFRVNGSSRAKSFREGVRDMNNVTRNGGLKATGTEKSTEAMGEANEKKSSTVVAIPVLSDENENQPRTSNDKSTFSSASAGRSTSQFRLKPIHVSSTGPDADQAPDDGKERPIDSPASISKNQAKRNAGAKDLQAEEEEEEGPKPETSKKVEKIAHNDAEDGAEGSTTKRRLQASRAIAPIKEETPSAEGDVSSNNDNAKISEERGVASKVPRKETEGHTSDHSALQGSAVDTEQKEAPKSEESDVTPNPSNNKVKPKDVKEDHHDEEAEGDSTKLAPKRSSLPNDAVEHPSDEKQEAQASGRSTDSSIKGVKKVPEEVHEIEDPKDSVSDRKPIRQIQNENVEEGEKESSPSRKSQPENDGNEEKSADETKLRRKPSQRSDEDRSGSKEESTGLSENAEANGERKPQPGRKMEKEEREGEEEGPATPQRPRQKHSKSSENVGGNTETDAELGVSADSQPSSKKKALSSDADTGGEEKVQKNKRSIADEAESEEKLASPRKRTDETSGRRRGDNQDEEEKGVEQPESARGKASSKAEDEKVEAEAAKPKPDEEMADDEKTQKPRRDDAAVEEESTTSTANKRKSTFRDTDEEGEKSKKEEPEEKKAPERDAVVEDVSSSKRLAKKTKAGDDDRDLEKASDDNAEKRQKSENDVDGSAEGQKDATGFEMQKRRSVKVGGEQEEGEELLKPKLSKDTEEEGAVSTKDEPKQKQRQGTEEKNEEGPKPLEKETKMPKELEEKAYATTIDDAGTDEKESSTARGVGEDDEDHQKRRVSSTKSSRLRFQRRRPRKDGDDDEGPKDEVADNEVEARERRRGGLRRTSRLTSSTSRLGSRSRRRSENDDQDGEGVEGGERSKAGRIDGEQDDVEKPRRSATARFSSSRRSRLSSRSTGTDDEEGEMAPALDGEVSRHRSSGLRRSGTHFRGRRSDPEETAPKIEEENKLHEDELEEKKEHKDSKAALERSGLDETAEDPLIEKPKSKREDVSERHHHRVSSLQSAKGKEHSRHSNEDDPAAPALDGDHPSSTDTSAELEFPAVRRHTNDSENKHLFGISSASIAPIVCIPSLLFALYVLLAAARRFRAQTPPLASFGEAVQEVLLDFIRFAEASPAPATTTITSTLPVSRHSVQDDEDALIVNPDGTVKKPKKEKASSASSGMTLSAAKKAPHNHNNNNGPPAASKV